MSLVSSSVKSSRPVSSSGNIFGCFVDGEVFIPEAVPGQSNAVYAEIQDYQNFTGINICADNYSGSKSFIIFLYNLEAIEIGQKYDLTDPDLFVQYIDFGCSPSSNHRQILKGNITINKMEILEPAKRTVAGTFEFTIANDEHTTTAEITHGEFDLDRIREW